ncbi:MAG: hypothetical protein L0H53_00255 [Candidatus Nitrosocosmicus sp.]|nr:hypothetical protein [Candidatus Nitrosocosmicus sp.]MDN5866365.1 hypothetical protein [Candidatus Nitrosocosmicus sp.]
MISVQFQIEGTQNTTEGIVWQTWLSQHHLPEKYYNGTFKNGPKNHTNNDVG